MQFNINSDSRRRGHDAASAIFSNQTIPSLIELFLEITGYPYTFRIDQTRAGKQGTGEILLLYYSFLNC